MDRTYWCWSFTYKQRVNGCAFTLELHLQISHGNTAAHAAEHGDKVLGRICAAIAGDEARHEKAYIKIVDALFERCGTIVSISLSG